MQPTVPIITTLSEDVLDVLKRFDDSLDMICLCKDVSDPILMEDEKPVLDVTQDQFIGVFDLKFDHYFLSPAQVFRLALYCKLELPSIIALMLKSSWEVHLAKMIGYAESEMQLESQLRNGDTVAKHLSTFVPDNHAIHKLISQIPYDTSMEKSRENVNMVIYDLLNENKIVIGNSLVEQHFPVEPHTEAGILKSSSKDLQQEYIGLKTFWDLKSNEFEEQLLALEQKKRININTIDRYFRVFGSLELLRAALNCKIEKFNKVLKLKFDYPNICFREALKIADETISNSEKTQNDIRDKYARSLNCIQSSMGGGSRSFTSNDNINYETACKKILKQLYLLLHPDMMSYQRASAFDQEQLDKLWLDVMQSTEERLVSYGHDLLLYRQPDYYKLKALLHKVCEILHIDMSDLEVGDPLELLIKRGSSTKQLIQFLKSDLESIQLHLAKLELVQYDYSNDKQTQSYREALIDPDTHREKLEAQISKTKDQIVALKDDIRSAFKKAAA